MFQRLVHHLLLNPAKEDLERLKSTRNSQWCHFLSQLVMTYNVKIKQAIFQWATRACGKILSRVLERMHRLLLKRVPRSRVALKEKPLAAMAEASCIKLGWEFSVGRLNHHFAPSTMSRVFSGLSRSRDQTRTSSFGFARDQEVAREILKQSVTFSSGEIQNENNGSLQP